MKAELCEMQASGSSRHRAPLQPLNSFQENESNVDIAGRRVSKLPISKCRQMRLSGKLENVVQSSSTRPSASKTNATRQTRCLSTATQRQQASAVSFTGSNSAKRRLTSEDKRTQGQREGLQMARDDAKVLRETLISNEAVAKNVQELKEMLTQSKENEATRIQELTVKLSTLESKLVKAETEILDKSKEINKVTMELGQACEQGAAERNELSTNLKSKTNRCANLERDIQKMQATISALEADKKSMDQILSSKNQELEQLNIKLSSHDPEKSDMKTEILNLQQELDRIKREKSDLEKDLFASNSRLTELQQTICKLEVDVVERTSEVDRVIAQNSSLAFQRDTLAESLTAESRKSATQIKSLEQNRDEVEDLLRNAEQEIFKCEQKQISDRKEMEEKISGLTISLAQSKSACNLTRKELDAATEEMAQYRSAIKSQDGALAIVRSQVGALEVKLSAQLDLCVAKNAEIETLKKIREKQSFEIEKLEQQAHIDEEERRKLHNALQELKGNIRVFCRVRPLLSHEKESSLEPVFSYHDKSRGITAIAPASPVGGSSKRTKEFKFDKVFNEVATQEDVFAEISQLVQSALDGYRVCIFAYGQTGSGKTHTIIGNEHDLGVVPRSVQQVFDRAERLAKDQWRFEFQASFLEIYNEKIVDLLDKGAKLPGNSSTIKSQRPNRDEYAILHDEGSNECTVEGLTVVDVPSSESATGLILQAMKNRATAATLSNANSSRSHSVFRLYISGQNESSGQKLRGVLNLVDLAGSERVKVSNAGGDRLREAKAINKSLSQLSIVIQSLANKEKHIPYRSSKLTRLLQDSLGGDCKTLMFVNVSPLPQSYSESICSLRFAEQVNACDIGVASRSTKIDLLQDM